VSPVPDHWITANEGAAVPSRFVIMDTEAREITTRTGQEQRWRCGVANFIHWTSKGNIKQRVVEYADAPTMWTDIGAHARARSRTIVYSHNLPFGMRIARALECLPRDGWKLENVRLDSRGSWSRWSRNKASLILCDTASIFPCTLGTLALLGAMPPIPRAAEDDDGSHVTRCRAKVRVLSRTMIEYLTWLKSGAAGNWQMTGSSQAWSHWRHSYYDERILIHHDAEAIAAERRALYTGRAEAWRWGRDASEPVFEWDWQNAYPRVARDVEVPTRYVGTSHTIRAASLPKLWNRYAILADVTVRTERPIVPTRTATGILWPVGEFDATLWDPELRLLIDSGADVRVRQVWLYQKGPALRSWAQWVLDGIHSTQVRELRWLPVVLKHWSRSLIGRFSMRYQTWEHVATLPGDGIAIGTYVDADTDAITDTMQLGHELYLLGEFQEAPNACPQITGYIMSESRAKLWRVIQAIGESEVLYMDTDSVLTTAKGSAIIESHQGAGDFAGLRLKDRHRGWEIYGPRAAVFGEDMHFSGLPRGAERTSDNTFIGEVWTGLEQSVRKGEFDHVSITRRPFTVRWSDTRRWRAADGTTIPHRLPVELDTRPAGGLEPSTEAEHIGRLSKALRARRVATAGP
jgi:hypothetical protein